MAEVQEREPSTYRAAWPELPEEIFAVLRKPNRAINPVSVVATVEPDGSPHTAPFGSLRAVTPRRLLLCCNRYHDTFANLRHDPRVMVAVLAPPNIAVSIQGRAGVVQEHMNVDPNYAILEIDVNEVKNDMPRSGVIDSAIVFSPLDQFGAWFENVLCELEGIAANPGAADGQ